MKFKFHANFLFHLFIGFCLLEIRNEVENSVWCNANNDIPSKQINRDNIQTLHTQSQSKNKQPNKKCSDWMTKQKKKKRSSTKATRRLSKRTYVIVVYSSKFHLKNSFMLYELILFRWVEWMCFILSVFSFFHFERMRSANMMHAQQLDPF